MPDYKNPEISLPDSAQAIKLEQDGSVVITALKKAFDRSSLIVRVLNIGDTTANATLALGYPHLKPKAIYETDLDEIRILRLDGETISFKLTPKKLKTFEFEM